MEMSRLSQTEGVSTSIKCRQCGYRPYLLIFNENGNASRHPYLSVSVCLCVTVIVFVVCGEEHRGLKRKTANK